MDIRMKSYPVDIVKTWEIHGEAELVESVSVLGVLEPIILGKNDGKFKILAGHRRCASLLKAVANLEETGSPIPEHLRAIRAVVYEDISDIDANAISIAENEQRSANPVNTWKRIQEASRSGNFDAVVALAKLNKNRLQAINKLNEVRPALIDAYDAGKISESTLMATSTLGPARQDFLLEILKTKKRITMPDVKEAKKARTAAVLATAPTMPNLASIQASVQATQSTFLVLTGEEAKQFTYTTFVDAMAAKGSKAGAEIYRKI